MRFGRTSRALPAILTTLAVTVAVAPPAGAAYPKTMNPGASSSPPGQLVTNGGFERGVAGWTAATPRTRLSTTPVSRSGSRSLVVTTTAARTAALTDRPNSVAATTGRHFARAWVRTTRPGQAGRLEVVLRHRGAVAGSASRAFRLPDRGWHRVQLGFAAGRPVTVDLRVVALDQRPGHRFFVDDALLKRVPGQATRPRTRPATSPQPRPKPRPSAGSCAFSPRGISTCGPLVGAGYNGNSDPSAWEKEMGKRLGVRRTYFNGAQVDSAVRMAKTDLANGRLPWISFKLPKSWSAMAAGQGDAWTKDLAKKLSRLDGPVWLAFHHEPEGDGNIATWKAMQERLGPIVRRNAPNVAFTVVLTGWNQLYGEKQYSLDRMWPNTKVDVAGFDVYLAYGAERSDGTTHTKMTDMRDVYWNPLSKWAKKKGVAWGLAETGYTDEAHRIDPGWPRKTYSDLKATGAVAFTYFNSQLHSHGSWSLRSQSKRAAFARAVKVAPTLAP